MTMGKDKIVERGQPEFGGGPATVLELRSECRGGHGADHSDHSQKSGVTTLTSCHLPQTSKMSLHLSWMR